MNWLNNLLTLATTTAETVENTPTDSQLIWLVLAGLFLIVIIAVIIAVASTSAASAAVAVDDDHSANM